MRAGGAHAESPPLHSTPVPGFLLSSASFQEPPDISLYIYAALRASSLFYAAHAPHRRLPGTASPEGDPTYKCEEDAQELTNLAEGLMRQWIGEEDLATTVGIDEASWKETLANVCKEVYVTDPPSLFSQSPPSSLCLRPRKQKESSGPSTTAFSPRFLTARWRGGGDEIPLTIAHLCSYGTGTRGAEKQDSRDAAFDVAADVGPPRRHGRAGSDQAHHAAVCPPRSYVRLGRDPQRDGDRRCVRACNSEEGGSGGGREGRLGGERRRRRCLHLGSVEGRRASPSQHLIVHTTQNSSHLQMVPTNRFDRSHLSLQK